MFFLIVCLLLLSSNVNAMNKEDKEGMPEKKAFVQTFLRECRKKENKSGLCLSVEGEGITINSEKKGPVIKLTTRVRKFTDNSNNPEFQNNRNHAFDSSFVGLRGYLSANYNYEKSSCVTRHSDYLEKSSGRSCFAFDLECKHYIARKKFQKLNDQMQKEMQLSDSDSGNKPSDS